MSLSISENLKTVASDDGNSVDSKSAVAQYRNTFIAGIISLLFIFCMGMTISYTAPATVDMKKPGSRLRDITDDEITWIGSLTMLGGVPANILGGYFTHKFGRKAVLMMFSPLFLISWLMITYASSVVYLYVGRIISGFCTGLYVVASPAYLSEIAPIEIRGLLTALFPLANNLGMLAVMGLGIPLRWSWLAMSIAISITIATFLMFFMPESPAWLVKESKVGQAAMALKFLRGKHFDTKKEIEDHIKSNSNQKSQGLSFKDLLNPILYKPIGISFCLTWFFATTGFVPVFAFTVQIFQEAKSTIDPEIAAVVLAFTQIIASAFCGSIIDKFGRRKLYIISGIGTCITLIALGAHSLAIQNYSGDHHRILGYVPLICFVIYAFVLTIGIGTMPFVMVAEMVPIRFRSALLSFTMMVASIINFLVTKLFVDMNMLLGTYGVYWTYAFFTFISILFGYFILPETKNLPVDEISKLFTKKNIKS